MNLTLTHVNEETRTWESKYGPMATIKLRFSDGQEGEVNSKPGNATTRIAEFKALIGQPGEWEVEQGQYGYKVKSWPGKVLPGSGPNAPRGKTQEERNEIIALATLRDAVTMCVNSGKPYDVSLICSIHEKFYVNVLRLARGK